MYFGSRELRALLRSLHRDLVRYPILEAIRTANNDTLDRTFLEKELGKELEQTRFIALGAPAESGCHLLYYYRQENRLPVELFVDAYRLFRFEDTDTPHVSLREPKVRRIIVIDDIAGSGSQALRLSKDLIPAVKRLNPNIQIKLLTLFATSKALKEIADLNRFDIVDTVYELDPSFYCFSSSSRYFDTTDDFDKAECKRMCAAHGARLSRRNPLGYGGVELLLGFHHNVPNNTLPIIWYTENPDVWTPIFPRYPKRYKW